MLTFRYPWSRLTMMADGPLAAVQSSGGRTTLRFTRSLRHAIEKVWHAATDSDQMRWWMPADMVGEREAGATVQMVFWPDLVEARGLDPDAGPATIHVWDPWKTFEYDWHGSQIRFDFAAKADGVVELQLVVDIDTDDEDLVVDNAGGFHLWMDHFTRLLDTGASPAIAEADAAPIQAAYRAAYSITTTTSPPPTD